MTLFRKHLYCLLGLMGARALALTRRQPFRLRRRNDSARLPVEAIEARPLLLLPQPPAFSSADERFLGQITDTIEQYMSDERFNVEELAHCIGLSRSQLHRKLRMLTGQPPVEFIRMFRLQRAMAMLRAGAGNVSETGYAVGFNSPAYFARVFKDAFGVSPSAVRRSANAVRA